MENIEQKRKNYEKMRKRFFESKKLSGLKETIFDHISQLRFARFMRSIELWQKAEAETRSFCEALADNGHLKDDEAWMLYDFIMSSAKRSP